LQRVRFAAERSRSAVRLPAAASRAVPNAGAQLDVAGLPPWLTPAGDFYRVDTALTVPQVAADTWKLRVHGKVDHPVTITYDQLLKRSLIERDITLTCVSNEVGGPYIGNARWLGAGLAALLREAGIHSDADQLVSRSADGMTIGTPTSAVLDGRDAMLAVGMNGQPLPVEHGFPVRMVVPGLYGYVSACKWIVDLEATTFGAYDAYWVSRGWAQQGPIKTESRIDTPRDGASKPAGTVQVAGVAWAQHRGIRKVEVQVDGGAWHAARLAAAPTTDTWRQWVWSWPATKGDHTIRVRATDTAGTTQTADEAPPLPDGATGYHTISVKVH
jgi:DMSO/TMAO reductase YedYZ molybdopterin-dependent catalytic subunit